MLSDVQTRSARKGDANGISRVICGAITQINSRDYPQVFVDHLAGEYTPSKVQELLVWRLTFVATVENQIIGTAALSKNIIKAVFVDPEYQRKGVGTLLMSEVERSARVQGLEALSLSSSVSAVSFYHALGYRVDTSSFPDEDQAVLMSKKKI